eukprot:SAG31_NODE_121_length_23854_cov_16.182404_3_plen_279_part_00
MRESHSAPWINLKCRLQRTWRRVCPNHMDLGKYASTSPALNTSVQQLVPSTQPPIAPAATASSQMTTIATTQQPSQLQRQTAAWHRPRDTLTAPWPWSRPELDDDYDSTAADSALSVTIPKIWQPDKQGERMLSHHFPEHYRIWHRDAIRRGIKSADYTFRMATQGWTPEFHSTPVQKRRPPPPHFNAAQTKMMHDITADFIDRNIVYEVSAQEMQTERDAKPYKQIRRRVYLEGLPFKVPLDVRPFTSIMFPVDKGPGKLARGGAHHQPWSQDGSEL